MLVLATLRHQARRFLAPGLAVVLGVAFVAATLVLGASLNRSVMTSLSGDLGQYAVVVTSTGQDSALTDTRLEQVRESAGVAGVHAVRSAQVMIDGGFGLLVTPPRATSAARLTDGRLPATPGEVAVSSVVASQTGVRLGDVLGMSAAGHASSAPSPRVVGVVDAGRDARYGAGMPVVFATDSGITALTGATGWVEFDVVGLPGTDPAALRDTITAALGATTPGSGLTVQTGTERAATMADAVGGANQAMTTFVLAFAGVTLVVSAIVVANTFGILLARRSRETALLRCVGATRGQLLRSGLGEALLLGIVFSVFGTGVGVAAGAGLVALAGRAGFAAGELTVAVPVHAWVVPLITGVVLMVVSSLVPTLRSTRVGPLTALHPAAATTVSSRAGRFRLLLGLVAFVVGAAAVAAGGISGSLLVAFPGGVLSIVGVLVLAGVVVPVATRLVGRPASKVAGVPGDLAVDNTVRNPGRAAATASALLVGVTLVTMTVVGAPTAARTIDGELDRAFAIDAAVTSRSGHLAADAPTTLGRIRNVARTGVIEAADVRIPGLGTTRVMGLTDDAKAVSRNPGALTVYRPGTLVLSEKPGDPALAAGRKVRVSGDVGSRELTVVVDDRLGFAATMSASDLGAVSSKPAPAAVLLRLADGAGVESVMDDVRTAGRALGDVEIGGSAPRRAEISSVVRVLMYVVGALLALSVVVAFVGVGNTLALSVHERQRETALLRALGVTKGQVRGMLAVEGALLAGVGALLGILLGIGYGVAGVSSLFEGKAQVVVTVPVLPIVTIIAGALLAGALASVLPARGAARTAPAAALALE